jgi:signal recognition particle subunit SRP54
MFKQLSDQLTQTFRELSGRDRITEQHIEQTLKQIERSLIEADVAQQAITPLMQTISSAALGQKIFTSVNAEQLIKKMVHDHLVEALCPPRGQDSTIQLIHPPVKILLAGLQGVGKTTTAAKLAFYLRNKHQKNFAMVSLDTKRAAAMDQLASLGEKHQIQVLPATPEQSPLDIAKQALNIAKQERLDGVIFDSAGRLAIDQAMMDEIQSLHRFIQPQEMLFVIDSMTGQDAAATAQAFDQKLNITGTIVSKVDADTRGGAVLSVRHLTNRPIKWMGTGEHIDGLMAFNAERIAGKMLGMGDIVGLVEQAESTINKKQAQKSAKKMRKGHFDYQDFYDQLKQIEQMGGMEKIQANLPAQMQKMPIQPEHMKTFPVIIQSMTMKEKQLPHLLTPKRIDRIARGSGVKKSQVQQLIKQFQKMQRMLKKMQKPSIKEKLASMNFDDQMPF